MRLPASCDVSTPDVSARPRRPPHTAFRTEQGDSFLPLRSCGCEKSLFSSGFFILSLGRRAGARLQAIKFRVVHLARCAKGENCGSRPRIHAIPQRVLPSTLRRLAKSLRPAPAPTGSGRLCVRLLPHLHFKEGLATTIPLPHFSSKFFRMRSSAKCAHNSFRMRRSEKSGESDKDYCPEEHRDEGTLRLPTTTPNPLFTTHFPLPV